MEVRVRLGLFPEKPSDRSRRRRRSWRKPDLIGHRSAVQWLASGRPVESSIPGTVEDFSACRASAESDPEYRTLSTSKMHIQRLAQKRVFVAYRVASRPQQLRRLATAPPPETPQPTPSSKPYQHEKPEPERSWLVQKIRENPAAFKIVRALSRALGYGSTKQVAGRRTLAMYEQVCAVKASEDRVFWQGEHLPLVCDLCSRRDISACDLPPTFQSWFTITNLHVWLLTVRLRALPQPHGVNHIQGLIDHFFLDVEDRIRAVLQPVNSDSPPQTDVYAPESASGSPVRKNRGRAPDRLVKQQMQVLKEQWAGLGMAFDLGLAMGDTEMAGAVWRNLLGARGARGIPYSTSPGFRRSINPLTGGKMSTARLKLLERGFESEEAKDYAMKRKLAAE